MINTQLIDQEFRPSTGSKIFYILIALCLLGFVIFFSSLQWKGGIRDKLIALPPMFFLSVFIIVQTCFKKLIITGDSIIYKTFFKTKVLAIKAVKGFRSGVRYIKLESNEDGTTGISFDDSDFAQGGDLMQWIRNNFTDLDAIDLVEEKRAYEEDDSMGLTAEQKTKRLENADTIAGVFSIGSIMLSFISIPAHHIITNSILILLPLTGLLIIVQSKHTIGFYPTFGKGIYASIGFGIMVPSFVLLFYAMDYYDWINAPVFWIYVSLFSVLFIYAMNKYGINKIAAPILFQKFFLLVTAVCFSIGATIMINCSFDTSDGRSYYSKLLEKYVSHDRGGNLYMYRISAWQTVHDEKTVRVNKGLYYKISTGQTVAIRERNGLLGIHWFTVKMPADNLIETKQYRK